MFHSDNSSGVHPEIFAAMMKANKGYTNGYGRDEHTQTTIELMNRVFVKPAKVLFFATGSMCNVFCLRLLSRGYQAVFVSDFSHMGWLEVGAPEVRAQCKLYPVPNTKGKLTPEAIEAFYTENLSNFSGLIAPPIGVSIEQLTYGGELYSPLEIMQLADYCHNKGWYLHMDGARLANAAVALDCSLAQTSSLLGVDILSFGGTKNGCMFAESVLVFNEKLWQDDLALIQRQSGHQFSKMRYASVQFHAYLEKNLWKKNAQRANKICDQLATKLLLYTGISCVFRPDGNMLWIRVEDPAMVKVLTEVGNAIPFSFAMRLVASFVNQQTDIDKLCTALDKLGKRQRRFK